jgi:peptide/nickel transport system ATP-binding protein
MSTEVMPAVREESEIAVTLLVDGLAVDALTDGRPIVRDIAFDVRRGETVGLVGESGSGKTTVSLSLLGHARPGTVISDGSVSVAGQPVLGVSQQALRSLRGRRISYVPQDASTSLSPSMRVGLQLQELLRAHEIERDLKERVAAACAAAQFPTSEGELRRWPHQLSGGQRQRLAIAMALLADPEVVVMDEPTTGLDVTTQAHLLRTVKSLVRHRQIAVVYVTHDLAVVRNLADRVVVLREGRLVEMAPVEQIFRAPAHPYTRELLGAVPRLPDADEPPRDPPPPRPIALAVRGLSAAHGRNVVVDELDFELGEGRCLAVVGESGSGKTTLMRCLAGMHRRATGSIELGSLRLRPDGRRRPGSAHRLIQLVPQDPDTSLNPDRIVAEIVGRPLRQFEHLRGGAQRRRVAELLEQVKLTGEIAARLPRELSGGQKQRVAIARALAASPSVLLCDEVTSALDVNVQDSILGLLTELRETLGTAMVFVSHDLAVVGRISDEVIVLRRGECCERGPTSEVLTDPQHDYTRELLEAVPRLHDGDVGS